MLNHGAAPSTALPVPAIRESPYCFSIRVRYLYTMPRTTRPAKPLTFRPSTDMVKRLDDRRKRLAAKMPKGSKVTRCGLIETLVEQGLDMLDAVESTRTPPVVDES